MKILTTTLFIILIVNLFGQIAPYPAMSYDATLCEDELFKTQMICLNDRINEETGNDPIGISEHSENLCVYVQTTLPPYNNFNPYSTTPYLNCPGVCCGPGGINTAFDATENRTAYYTINLNCINNTSNVAITKLNENCWSVSYLAVGTYVFSLDIEVRHGREIEGQYNTCDDTNYFYGCGQNRSWKQFTVQVGNQFECNDYIENDCNLIQNGGFEDMINCPIEDFTANPQAIQLYNFNQLISWAVIIPNFVPFFHSTCENFGGYTSQYVTQVSNYQNYPPQPLPSGDNYVRFDFNYGNSFMGQYLNLCHYQKYKLGFFAVKCRGNFVPPPFSLSGLNTTNFQNNDPTTLLSTVNIDNNSLAWNEYSSTFTCPANFNGIRIDGTRFMIDNLSLIPVDTLTYTAQVISNNCDSAALTLHIPGCYGPYNVSIEVNNNSIVYSHITDGTIIHVPLGVGGTIKIGSITNSLGCTTVLDVTSTISILNPGNADFIASDFCYGDQNTITFLGDHGEFSLIGNTTGAVINSTTGIISNPTPNTSYIIEHHYCLDTEYDTVFVTNHNASFTSSDICFGGTNTIAITGETGGVFSILPPNNGASVNAGTGILTNVTENSSYTLQYVVGSVCPDTAINSVFVNSLDDASFTTSNFCFNETNVVTITGTQGGTFSFLPQPSDGATIHPVLGTISNPTVGQFYTIQYLTNGVCKDSSTQTIIMHPYHNASFTSSDICFGGTNTITITGGTGGVFELLPPNDGAIVNANSGILSNITENSTYTLQYVVGSVCQDTVLASIYVHSVDNPSFTTSNYCFNETNVISITGSTGGTFSFQPQVMDGAIIQPNLGTVTNGISGQTYTIQYVTNGICKDSSLQTITVLPLPSATLSGIEGDLCVNDSLPIFIALSGVSPWNIVCSNGTTNFILTSTSNLITNYIHQIGTYSIISVSDAQCTNIGDTVHFIKMTGDSIIAFSDLASGCHPTEVQFWSNVSGNDLDCLWNFGDGTIVSSCDTISHTYVQSGIYSVQFSVSSPRCFADTLLYQYIEIYEDPYASFTINPTDPSIIHNMVVTENLSINNNQNYWYLNQSIVSNTIEPNITFPSIIQQNELCLVVESIHHCYDTSCVEVFVKDASLIFLPNTFIPDGDGLNDLFKPEASNIRFYELQIFDRWGEIIFKTTDLATGWDGTINGQEAPIGTYIYKLSYRYNGDQENYVINGHINLIR